jgi:hypothetical protein
MRWSKHFVPEQSIVIMQLSFPQRVHHLSLWLSSVIILRAFLSLSVMLLNKISVKEVILWDNIWNYSHFVPGVHTYAFSQSPNDAHILLLLERCSNRDRRLMYAQSGLVFGACSICAARPSHGLLRRNSGKRFSCTSMMMRAKKSTKTGFGSLVLD